MLASIFPLARSVAATSIAALSIVAADAFAVSACTQVAVSSLVNLSCSIGNLLYSFGSQISIRDDFHLTTTHLSDLTFTPLSGANGFTITGPLVTPGVTGKTVEIELDMGGFNTFFISTIDGTSTIAGVTATKYSQITGSATSFTEFNVNDATPGRASNLAYAQPGLGSNANANSVTLGLSSQTTNKVFVSLIALGGVTSGPGNVVGITNTVNSINSTFIVNTGTKPLPAGTGNAGMNAILPVGLISTPDGISNQFNFPVVPNDLLTFDPPVAVGYIFDARGGPSFHAVSLPTVGNSHYVLHFFDGRPDVTLAANTTYTFSQAVDRFEVLGIDPAANLDPTSGTAFQVRLAFATGGTTNFTMTAVTAVPEPHAPTMLLAGLLLIATLVRNRKMQASI